MYPNFVQQALLPLKTVNPGRIDYGANEDGKFALPVILVIDDVGVLDGLEERLAPVRLHEEAPQVGQRPALRAFEEGEDGVAEHRGHLVAPRRREPPEDGHQVRGEQVFLDLVLGTPCPIRPVYFGPLPWAQGG